MNHKLTSFVPAAVGAVLLVACGQQKPPEEAAASVAEMKNDSPAMAPADAPMPQGMQMGEKAESQVHNAMGTVTAVDAATGTVTIAHDAVSSANWPAMTMTFKLANPKLAAELHASDQVRFTFVLGEKGDATVTTIAHAPTAGK